jgi:ubiquinone/menaquinone biosynthesis C-methylase UbiE
VDAKAELAAKGFNNGDLYNAARPNYPLEAIEFLVSTFGLNEGSAVLDLGAGTGIFTRQLLPYVGQLIAVDPSSSMRASFQASTPGVEILEGSDVAIPLASGAIDAVFVAQAFHWFDAPRALQEIHRVLRGGGGLGLIWNERDESVDWVAELTRAMEWDVRQPYKVGMDFSRIVAAGPFVDVQRVRFSNAQTLTHEGLTQRVLTTSYLAAMSAEERAPLMTNVATVIDKLPEPVVMPYVTDVYCARAATS